MMRTPDHLGRLGERTVAAWLSQDDIVVNESGDDRTGFDFLVELPTGDAREGRGAPFKALLQVKAVDRSRGYIDIKLDNWQRLTRTPLPAFIAVLDFAGEPAPQRAFLVHVWESQIRAVEERLHRHERAPGKPLHKQTLRLVYGDAHRVDPEAAAFTSALVESVGPSLDRYVRNKLGLLDSVGYGHARTLARLAVVLPDGYDSPADLFVDLALGIVEGVDAASVALHDLRFGTTAEEPYANWPSGGDITVRLKDPEPAELLFQRTDGLGEIRVPAHAILPHGAGPFITEHNLKVRFITPFAEFVVEPGRRRCTFAFEWPMWNEPSVLDALGRHAALLLFVHRCREEGAAIVIAPSYSVRGEPRMLSQSEPTAAVDLMPDGLPQWLVDELTAVHAAWTVARACDAPPNESVYLGECVDKSALLRNTADLLGPNPQHAEVPFASDTPTAYFRPGDTIAIPYVTGFSLGPRGYLIGLGFVGVPKAQHVDEEGRFHFVLETQDVRVTDRVVVPGNAGPWPTDVLLARTANALRDQGLTVIEMDPTAALGAPDQAEA